MAFLKNLPPTSKNYVTIDLELYAWKDETNFDLEIKKILKFRINFAMTSNYKSSKRSYVSADNNRGVSFFQTLFYVR